MNVELVRYDAACRALAEAVDEVMLIRDEAAAIAACARIANNHQAEADAVALRMRATRRLGQLMQAQKETVGVNRGAAGGGAMTLRSSSELADDEGRVFVAYGRLARLWSWAAETRATTPYVCRDTPGSRRKCLRLVRTHLSSASPDRKPSVCSMPSSAGWPRGAAMTTDLKLDRPLEQQPCREGFVGYDEDGHFVHYCHCGKWGSFGHNVSLREGKLGTWYCREHRPCASLEGSGEIPHSDGAAADPALCLCSLPGVLSWPRKGGGRAVWRCAAHANLWPDYVEDIPFQRAAP
jgi:hypothetical protein